MIRLLPIEINFFAFFNKHAKLLVTASKEFLDCVSNEQIVLQSKKIKRLEHDADEIVHQCLKSLHQTKITPFDKELIYQLISSMDDVLDAIDTAYNDLNIYKIETSTPGLGQLATVVYRASLKIEQVVYELNDLSNAENILKECREINALENEADQILKNLLTVLFENEKDVNELIKWKEVYETLEDATDRAEDVADTVQAIISSDY